MRAAVLSGLFFCSLVVVPSGVAAGLPEAGKPEHGAVQFRPLNDQKNVPERYRLAEHTFDYELEYARPLPVTKGTLYRLRFPSPVETDCPENNTVHAEYYLPEGKGPFPCVIVLDITGGDQSLSRTISMCLTQNRIAGLFVQMAYYGPRRPPGSRRRLMTTDLPQTLANVRQTVLDLRRAAAWMESRDELDPKRLGILGTSLGSFMSALTGEMEPRLGRVGVMLGGGGLVEAFTNHPQTRALFKPIEVVGLKEPLKRLIAPADPITWAANLKDRKLLIIAASRDEIVPASAAQALWEASGKQKIVWYPTTHYGAALYFVAAMDHVVKHFGAE